MSPKEKLYQKIIDYISNKGWSHVFLQDDEFFDAKSLTHYEEIIKAMWRDGYIRYYTNHTHKTDLYGKKQPIVEWSFSLIDHKTN